MSAEPAMLPPTVNPGFRQNIRELPQHLGAGTLANALVAWLFGATGPLLITLAAASQGNLPQPVVVSWVFAIYFLGGVMSLILSLVYRQPIAGAHTIPAAVLVGTALTHRPFAQVVGTYWLAGLLIMLLGASGLVRRVMERLPMPIMMGMVAAVLLPFAVAIIKGLQAAPLLGAISVAAYLLAAAVPGLRRVPPVLAAIVAGLAGATWTGAANWGSLSLTLARPVWVAPEWNGAAAAELVVPLVLMVVVTQNAQGFAALRASGYRPPVTPLTVYTGAGTLAFATLGGHPACIAGPMTAIIAAPSSGQATGRYAAGVVLGVLWMITGLLAPAAATITAIVPRALVDVLGGLALLGALAQFFHQAFGSRFRIGALVAFLVTASGISLWHVAAPFWALVGGSLASAVLERGDFRRE